MVKKMSITSKDSDGNELKAEIQNVINEMELDTVKQLGKIATDIAEVKKDTNYIAKELIRIESDYVKSSDLKGIEGQTSDHEKRLRFLERGYWIGLTIITIVMLFRDSIVKLFSN